LKEEDAKMLVPDVIEEETVWACTTCGSCEQQCPVVRGACRQDCGYAAKFADDGKQFPHELKAVFTGMERHGNPWGSAAAKRIG